MRTGDETADPAPQTERAADVTGRSSRPGSWSVRDRVGTLELRRHLWHMSPGALAFVLWAFPHRDPIGPILKTIIVALGATLATVAHRHFHRVARRGESRSRQGQSVFGYAIPIVAMFLLFPAHAELGMAVLAIVAFGDSAATLSGLYFRGPKLPWNRCKTFSGTAAFLVCSAVMATLAYWLEARPVVPFMTAATCVVPTSAFSAIVESLPLPLNDNGRVAVAAAGGIIAAQRFFVGS